MKSLSQDEQAQITMEMTQNNKELLDEFIISYSPKDELLIEYVNCGILSLTDFNNIYDKTILEYCGR